jgi:outer membrane protein OmpA-like peptidoglycan-associated protein
MKATEAKIPSTTGHLQQKMNGPFFNKGGEDTFFSKGAKEPSAFFNSNSIQKSMSVGQPDDPFEKEADKVSRQVMDGFDHAGNIQRKLSAFGLQQFMIQPLTIGNRISRKLQKTISPAPMFAQSKCEECEREEKMQKKSGTLQFAGEGAPVSPAIENKIQSAKGGGQQLDTVIRAGMEASFGADFSGVRTHTDSNAVQMSKELNAHAFTVGNDIFFNQNRYQPHTQQGAGLLAHELTHTVQQGGSLQSGELMKMKEEDRDIYPGAVGNTIEPPSSNPRQNSIFFAKEIQRNVIMPDIQKADVLENNLSTVPNNITCPVSNEKLTDPGASLEITFNRAGTDLTQEDINNIVVFVNRWHDSALSVPVSIHGYASKDGAPAFNWPLSCKRAEVVAKQMQIVQPAFTASTGKVFAAGRPGIPAGFVQKFAHGETEDFSKTDLLPNRRAMVFVPTLPTLPAKLTKAPTAKLKTGPTYTPNGNIPVTKTAASKNAPFKMTAEFEDDPANGILASCGEIRQYIKWSNNNVDPARFGHEGFLSDKTYIPDTWYEDRHQENFRYGHRRGPHFFNGGVGNQYLDAKGKVQDFLNGPLFQGRDNPSIGGPAAFITSWVGTYEFKLTAIDVCNGNKVLGEDNLKIDW